LTVNRDMRKGKNVEVTPRYSPILTHCGVCIEVRSTGRNFLHPPSNDRERIAVDIVDGASVDMDCIAEDDLRRDAKSTLGG